MNDNVGSPARTFALEDASGTKILSLTWHRDVQTIQSLSSKHRFLKGNEELKRSVVAALRPLVDPFSAPGSGIEPYAWHVAEVFIDAELIQSDDINSGRQYSVVMDGIIAQSIPVDPQAIIIIPEFWNIASAIVGQKHLADISRSLKRIEGRIDRIAQHLDLQEIAYVRSTSKTLQDYHSVCQKGSLPQRSKDNLEKIYQGLGRHFDVWIEKAKVEISDVKTAKYWGFLGDDEPSDTVFKDIERRVCNLVFCAKTYNFALRIDASQATTEEERTLLRTRENHLNEFIDDLDKLQNNLDTVLDKLLRGGDSPQNVKTGVPAPVKSTSAETSLAGFFAVPFQKRKTDRNRVLQKKVKKIKDLVYEAVHELKHVPKPTFQLQSAQRFLIEYQNGVPVAAYHAVGGPTY